MKLDDLLAAAKRAVGRSGTHLRRAAAATAAAGPGRIAGNVVRVEVGPDHVNVYGWVLAEDLGSTQVFVAGPGAPATGAALGLPVGADVNGDPYSQREGATGWAAVLDRKTLGSGLVPLSAVVLRGALAESIGSIVVELTPLGQFAAMDLPRPGEKVTGPVRVVGWAMASRGIDSVRVQIDRGEPVCARLMSMERPDVVASSSNPGPDAGISGWEAWAPLPSGVGPGDRVEVRSWAVTADGSTIELGDVDVEVESFDPPVKPSDHDFAAVVEARSRLLAATARRPSPGGLDLLVATHHLGLGGGQLYLQTLLLALLEQDDVTCTVLAPRDGVLRAELETAGARVQIVGSPPVDTLGYEAWMEGVVARAVAGGHGAVLANSMGSFWAVDLADRLDLPSVWAVHESFTYEHFLKVGFPAPPDISVAERLRAAFRQADRIVFEADATGDLFDELMPPGRRVRVDYGIDLKRIDAFLADNDRASVRRELGLEPDATVLVSMGTFEPRKAQPLLAVAFSRVLARHPGAVLAMVGDAPSPFSAALHHLVEGLGAGERIRLLPVTGKVHQWYLAADALVLASDIESLSRAMLEAIAIGTPVIVSEVFGHPEVIVDGVNGHLLEPSSVSSVVAALDRFLTLDAAERSAIAERARAGVLQGRDEASFAGIYRAVLDDAARSHRTSRGAVL
ncbi:MAG: glycosyltransferase family 4 protein [Actinobacteria bacterium]|nr:glycosyltransferase family 4 protein [Actinomycetota bacterium]MCG2803226.1 glycosyltransferase family 4 protein [Cellulomonas sp.]